MPPEPSFPEGFLFGTATLATQIEGSPLDTDWHAFARKTGRIHTENGLADEDDDQRPRFIVRHFEAVLEAMRRGVDVRGSMHGSPLDNFEWHEGLWPRFGLSAVDYKTQERRPRRSAELYARTLRERRIPDGVWGQSEARPQPAARRASAR